jgi:hypothetical protein
MIRYAVHDGGCIIGLMVRGLLGGPSREPCRAVPTGKTPYQLDLPVFRILVRRVVRGLAALHVVGLCFFFYGDDRWEWEHGMQLKFLQVPAFNKSRGFRRACRPTYVSLNTIVLSDV